jgi:predicted secreted protein
MTSTSIRRAVCAAAVLGLLAANGALGQVFAPALPTQPVVTVSAAATASVATDRVQAWLRAEAESADPAAAAREVNAAMGKAIARAKTVSVVKAATSGYATQQVLDKGKSSRWRVGQTLTLDSGDFVATTSLIDKLQNEDGLLVSGIAFSLSAEARRRAEESITQEAIRGWQERAQRAAQELGFAAWRPGHVTVQTGDAPRVYPTMRAAASVGGAPPVVLEGGNVDVSVTVTGDAVLQEAKR